ncbi:hypothetical protein AB0B31_27500 [Catellatospora citrea]|uniref:hypothetical protein n=1 Tax=Catellatospora citrea TaxID=53366 RepID=UPI0033E130AE
MRTLIRCSLAASGLFLLMVLDTLLPGGPRLPMPLVLVPFVLLFVCFAGVMHAVKGTVFGYLPMSKIWPLLRLLPPAVKAAGTVILVVAVANFFTATEGVTDEASFQRAFAGNGVWLSAAASILAYAVLLSEQLPAEARPAESPRAGRWWLVGSIALSAVMLVSWLTTPHVSDDRATHETLQSRYQATGWVSHLVAADTSHGVFFVYLDSADPAVQSQACDSLREYGKELGRVADLYHFDGQHRPSRMGSC